MRIVVMYNFRYMRDFRLISVYTLESHSQSYYGRNGRSRNHGIIQLTGVGRVSDFRLDGAMNVLLPAMTPTYRPIYMPIV